MRPPTSAPSSAAIKVSDGAGRAGMAASPALPRNAAASAGETLVGAAIAGQSPATLASVRQPWPPAASTMGMTAGLLARCGDNGTCAVHTAPCQAWVHWAAVSMTSLVSG